MADTKNVFISHVHKDDDGLQKLKNLLAPKGMNVRDSSIHTGKFNDATASAQAIRQEAWENITLCLSPITPHICRALWQALGHQDELIDRRYPQPDLSAMLKDSITMVIQVNGKLRGEMVVASDAERAPIEAAALQEPNVQKFLVGLTVRKVVVVPGKLVNMVAS